MSQHHVLRASPETCHWGFFDAGLKPVLSVASGDTVTIDSVSGGPDVLPDGRLGAAMSSFKREGVIAISYPHRIELLDRDGLEVAAKAC